MKLALKLIFGFLYSIGYVFLALLNGGPEANGTLVFFAPLLPWPFFLICVGLIGELHALQIKIFFVASMALYYGISITMLYLLLKGTDLRSSGIAGAWERSSSVMLFTFAWWISGQFLIWIVFTLEILQKDDLATKY
jgi:hypothetical protein